MISWEILLTCSFLVSCMLQELKPGNYLKDTTRQQVLEPQLSMSSKPAIPSHPAMSTPQPENAVALSAVTPTVTTTTSTTTTTPGSTPSLPPQPQFAFDDIITTSLAGLAPHISINEQVRIKI